MSTLFESDEYDSGLRVYTSIELFYPDLLGMAVAKLASHEQAAFLVAFAKNLGKSSLDTSMQLTYIYDEVKKSYSKDDQEAFFRMILNQLSQED